MHGERLSGREYTDEVQCRASVGAQLAAAVSSIAIFPAANPRTEHIIFLLLIPGCRVIKTMNEIP